MVKKFEDLRRWQAARALVKEVYLACSEGKLATDFDTRSQLRKAAMSSMNNIAEGFSRFHRKDSIRFFYDIAQSSAAEVLSMCYILEDMEYVSQGRIDAIRRKAAETRNLTLAFIKSNNLNLEEPMVPYINTLTP